MSKDTKAKILKAAQRLVARDGAANLTLHGVADEAQLSKGGLLYHFGSKESLISGMMDAFLEEFETSLQAELRKEEGPGSWIRAYVRASFAYDASGLAVGGALLAAAANTPDLMTRVKDAFARWDSRSQADDIPPHLVDAVRLAVDGLWFADVFGLAPPKGKRRDALKNQLLEMVTP